MLQQCVCQDIEHLGSLDSTQKARVAEPLSCSTNFPCAQHMHADAWTNKNIVNYIILQI